MTEFGGWSILETGQEREERRFRAENVDGEREGRRLKKRKSKKNKTILQKMNVTTEVKLNGVTCEVDQDLCEEVAHCQIRKRIQKMKKARMMDRTRNFRTQQTPQKIRKATRSERTTREDREKYNNTFWWATWATTERSATAAAWGRR